MSTFFRISYISSVIGCISLSRSSSFPLWASLGGKSLAFTWIQRSRIPPNIDNGPLIPFYHGRLFHIKHSLSPFEENTPWWRSSTLYAPMRAILIPLYYYLTLRSTILKLETNIRFFSLSAFSSHVFFFFFFFFCIQLDLVVFFSIFLVWFTPLTSRRIGQAPVH